jgi:hypothetical protein
MLDKFLPAVGDEVKLLIQVEAVKDSAVEPK